MLVFAVLFTALSIWTVSAVPEWKRGEEIRDSLQIQERFGELRSCANLLALKGTPGFTLSVPLRMDGGDIPLLPDAIRQGSLTVNPAGGELTITRYWGDEEPIYWRTGGFELGGTDLYFTDDGTLGGDPDWFPRRVIENLSAFEVSFSERTSPALPSPAPLRGWHDIFTTSKENRWEAQTFVANRTGALVKVALYLKRKGEPGELTIEIRDCAGADAHPGDTVLASTVTNEVASETGDEYEFVFAAPASVTAGNSYSIVLHESKDVGDESDRYAWAEYRESDAYPDGKVWHWDGRKWTEGGGGIHDFYFIVWIDGAEPVHPGVTYPVRTDFKVKLLHDGETIWEASFREEKNKELKIDVKDVGEFSIPGYFDGSSENHNKNLDLLDPKYGIGDSVAGKVPFDIKFEKGDKAYGSYTIAGTCPGGLSGGAHESWTCGMGVISFDMRNNYLADQIYSFEGGGVVLEQEGTSLMLLPPQIEVFTEGDITNVSIHIFDLRGPHYSGGGTGVVGVELSYKGKTVLYRSDRPETKALLIEIRTDRIEAWKEFFADTLEEAGLKEGSEFVVEERSPDILVVALLGKGEGKDVRLQNLSWTALEVTVGMPR